MRSSWRSLGDVVSGSMLGRGAAVVVVCFGDGGVAPAAHLTWCWRPPGNAAYHGGVCPTFCRYQAPSLAGWWGLSMCDGANGGAAQGPRSKVRTKQSSLTGCYLFSRRRILDNIINDTRTNPTVGDCEAPKVGREHRCPCPGCRTSRTAVS